MGSSYLQKRDNACKLITVNKNLSIELHRTCTIITEPKRDNEFWLSKITYLQNPKNIIEKTINKRSLSRFDTLAGTSVAAKLSKRSKVGLSERMRWLPQLRTELTNSCFMRDENTKLAFNWHESLPKISDFCGYRWDWGTPIAPLGLEREIVKRETITGFRTCSVVI